MQSPTSDGDQRSSDANPSALNHETLPSGSSSGLGNGAWRMARRVGVGIVGSIVLGVGLVLLVTPGPAFVVIPIGLGILAIEFDWARRWLDKVKQRVGEVLPRRERHGDSRPDSGAR